jgi:L-amino acid N-acyltransferase YncA
MQLPQEEKEMVHRSLYRLDLDKFVQPEPVLSLGYMIIRSPQVVDLEDLARLMLDAYRGTIDDDGKTYEDALNEVRAYFAGERGGPQRGDCSKVYELRKKIVSACLVAEREEQQVPIIAYIMTDSEMKRQGLARSLLIITLRGLRDLEYTEAQAVITDGNTPSEQLFSQLGFERVA